MTIQRFDSRYIKKYRFSGIFFAENGSFKNGVKRKLKVEAENFPEGSSFPYFRLAVYEKDCGKRCFLKRMEEIRGKKTLYAHSR